MTYDDDDYVFAEVDQPYVNEDGILIDPNDPARSDKDDDADDGEPHALAGSEDEY